MIPCSCRHPSPGCQVSHRGGWGWQWAGLRVWMELRQMVSSGPGDGRCLRKCPLWMALLDPVAHICSSWAVPWHPFPWPVWGVGASQSMELGSEPEWSKNKCSKSQCLKRGIFKKILSKVRPASCFVNCLLTGINKVSVSFAS